MKIVIFFEENRTKSGNSTIQCGFVQFVNRTKPGNSLIETALTGTPCIRIEHIFFISTVQFVKSKSGSSEINLKFKFSKFKIFFMTNSSASANIEKISYGHSLKSTHIEYLKVHCIQFEKLMFPIKYSLQQSSKTQQCF